MKNIPDKDILLFRTCLVSTEYPGVESSTKYVFDKLGVEYLVDLRQSCCTGLGHYYDLFDQFSTTTIAARNFHVAKDTGHTNIVTMCATCYAILKKSAHILNSKPETLKEVNQVFKDSQLEHLTYTEGDIDSTDNIFHIVEVLYSKKDKIKELINTDYSQIKVAAHHACHYCKVQYKDTIGGVRNPQILDELARISGMTVVGDYDHKRQTCGSGFRQRFANNKLSLEVTEDKLTSLKDDNIDILIHMCPNCHMQFDRYQPKINREKGTNFKIYHLHIAQFMALALGADPYDVLGIQTHTVPVEPLIEKITKIRDEQKNNNKMTKEGSIDAN